MLRRCQEELDELLTDINKECDPRLQRYFLRHSELWSTAGNYVVLGSGLTKNQLYDALRIFLAGIVAGKRYGLPSVVHHIQW